jgi:hypothetical protein
MYVLYYVHKYTIMALKSRGLLWNEHLVQRRQIRNSSTILADRILF